MRQLFAIQYDQITWESVDEDYPVPEGTCAAELSSEEAARIESATEEFWECQRLIGERAISVPPPQPPPGPDMIAATAVIAQFEEMERAQAEFERSLVHRPPGKTAAQQES
jgi:hypothetical protein